MHIEVHGEAAAAAEITALIKTWDEALRARDADALTAEYADAVCVFDVGSQLRDRNAYREQWQACLPWFGERSPPTRVKPCRNAISEPANSCIPRRSIHAR